MKKMLFIFVIIMMLVSCGNVYKNSRYKYKLGVPEGYLTVATKKMTDEAISFVSRIDEDDLLINYKDVDVVFYNQSKDFPHYEQVSINTIPSYINIRNVGSDKVEKMLLQTLAYKFDNVRVSRSENYSYGRYNNYRIDFKFLFNGEPLQSTTIFVPGNISSTQLIMAIYPEDREKELLEVINRIIRSYKKI